jgi:hypothetical protein
MAIAETLDNCLAQKSDGFKTQLSGVLHGHYSHEMDPSKVEDYYAGY